MGRSPLPHMSLPFHLNPQIAKASLCRLIPVKTFFLSLVFLVAFLLLPGIYNFGWGQTQTFTTTGAGQTFTVPAGVTSIQVECWGGGGGGSNRVGAAGGGGGGAYTQGTLSGLTGGNSISITVGNGGTIGVSGNASSATFGSNTIIANGGLSVNSSRNGGNGGSATTVGGIIIASFAGGDGGDARVDTWNNSNEGGGGGGGSATSNANGNNGGNATNTGGTGGTGTGNGGRGANGDGTPDAVAGFTPGGGGGGRGEGGGTSKAGADGQIIISWIPPYQAQFTAMNIGSLTWFAGEARTVTVTVKNTGQATWTDATPDVNIGVKWNADPDYLVRVDANGLAPGATQTYSLTITAPATTGTNNLTFDVVNEGDCWFGNNTGSCGPGNIVFASSDITILPIYYSSGNTNPANRNNWWTNTNGTGSHPPNFTTANQKFVIQNGHNMTTTSTWNVSGANNLVEIQNGGILTENNNITLSGTTTLQVDDGGTLNHNVNSLNIFGGTETLGTNSIVSYGFAGAQSVAAISYGNLTITGGGIKTAQGSISVTGTLNLNSGNLSLGSGAINLTLFSGANITGTFDNTHMVRCDGTGSLIKEGTTAADFIMVYPVGTGTNYTPYEITALTTTVAGTGSVSVRANTGAAPGPPPAATTDLNKYWNVSTSNLSGVNANLKLTYVNPSEIGTGGDQSKYVPYLYNGGSWTQPTIYSSAGILPMTVTGTSVIDGQWTAREEQATYYSYQSGSWITPVTWTTDPSGTLSVNPAVPGVNDRVVILNGRTVKTTPIGHQVLSVQINEGGTLDIGGTTGHNFGIVRGMGWLRLSTGTFPGGIFSDFVAAGGGTVEYYNAANFNLSQYTYNNLIFNLSASGTTGFVLSNLIVNGNLTIKQGDFRINDDAAHTRLDLEVNGNVLINSNGLISLGTGNIGTATTDAHRFIIKGDFTNNGQARFTNLPAANYFTYPNNRTDVIFNNPSADQNVIVNGYTRFYRIEIDKGSDQTYVLNIDATAANQFYLYGRNDLMGVTPAPDAPNINNLNALGLMTGTLRLGANITIPSLAEESAAGLDLNYHIDEDACLWIDGANVTHTTNANGGNSNSFVMYGKLRLTNPASIFTINNLHGIIMRATASIVIEDGTLSTPCVRTSTVTGTHRGSFNMSGGVMTVTGNLNGDLGHAAFSFTWPEMSFTMSGGELIINQATQGTANGSSRSLVIGSKSENTSVTGGTVRIIAANRDANFTTTAPFWNLIINSTNAAYTSQIVDYAGSGTSASAVTAQPLVVLNDFNITNQATFITNNQNITIGHDFSIAATSTYTPGTNTTYFNGAAGQLFTNSGTISAGLYNLEVKNSSNTSITQNLIIRNDLSIDGNCFLQDMSHTISVAGNISNSGTHTSQASGAIILNGTSAQTIGGSGLGIFGNLTINKTTGTPSIIANQSLTGNLRLASGLLDIGTYNLALGTASGVYDALTGVTTAFSGTKMIKLAGSQSDDGITKAYSSTANFLFPIGTATDYTPATIQFSAAPAQWGSVTVRPVAQLQPFTTSPNALNYYWKVTSNGFTGVQSSSVSHTYQYATSDIVVGTETNYIPAAYRPYSWVSINDNSKVVDASNTILFNNIDFVDGDYTAGLLSAFNSVKVFYSRQSSNWDDFNTWSNASVGGAVVASGSVPGTNIPGPQNPVVIGDSTISHTVTVPIGLNNITVGGLQINSGSTLDIQTTIGHNFGAIPDSKVSGTGRLMISSATAIAVFPGGDFGNFLTTGGGTVEYYNTGAPDFTLPVTKTYYNNLVLSPATGRYIVMPNIDLKLYGDYLISGTGTGVARLNSAAARQLTVEGDIKVTGGTLRLMNTSAQTIYSNKDLNITAGGTFDVSTTNNATNLLYIKGNLNNNGVFDMYGAPATGVCNVYFTGSEDKVISGTGTNEFNYLNVNKGSSRNTILDVTANNLTLSGSGTALVLSNGTFRVSNSLLNFILSTTSSFTIPTTAALSVNEGSVTIGTTNNNGDLILAGRLEIINNGIVNIGTVGDFNNDIQYATGGNPEIIVLGGSLNVNGQIRRPVTITSGSLGYTQGGTSTVTINGRAATNTRGMFEILNSGSSFNMSGGTLIISRNFNNSLYNEFYLVPETFAVTGGTIRLGSSSVTDGTEFNFASSVPVWNLIIDATVTTKTANLRIFPLRILNDLIIEGNSVFNATGLNVTIGGSLFNSNNNAGPGILNGGYQPGTSSQITTFNGSGSQTLNGSGANLTNFANLTINTPGSVTLSANSNLRVNTDLKLNSGNFVDGSNDITVVGNIYNSAIHSSPSNTGGIILAGSQKQTISGSGTGVFGNLALNNSLGFDMVDNSVINGMLTFNNGRLYIDDYLLTLGANATIAGTTNVSKMIILNGVISDAGVKKIFPSGASSFTYPIGVAGKYTPANYSFTSNPNSNAFITIKPVNQEHPSNAPPVGDELKYYWNVISGGFGSAYSLDHSYNYQVSDVTGVESAYVTGRYLGGFWIPPGGFAGTVNSTSHQINLTGKDYIDGEYTAGNTANFANLPTLYSINSGDWFVNGTWSKTDGGVSCNCVPDGNPVIIKTGHIITLINNFAKAYSVAINGTLDVGISVFHSLGHVSGNGVLKLTSTTDGIFVFPGGEFDPFMETSGSTIEFFGTNDASLPLKPGNNYKPYQNVIFSGTGKKLISAENLKVLHNLTIKDASTVLSNELFDKSITILGNWTDYNTTASGGFIPGKGIVTFNGTTPQILTVNGTTTEQFYNLKIDNLLGMTLAGAGKADVSKLLYLNNGNITTNSTNLLSISNTSTSAVIGGGNGSFVNGPLQKKMLSGSSFNFPVGDATGSRYGKLSLSETTSAGNYIAQYYNHNPFVDGYDPTIKTAPVDVVSNSEYWRVNGPVGSNANVTVRWDAISGIIPPDAATRTKLRIVEWNASWVNRGNLVTDGGTTSGTIKTSPIVAVAGDHRFTLGVEHLPTATITSGDASICNDGSSTSISIALTGTAPWTIKYKINGSNETTINNIGTSPYTLVVSNALVALASGGPGNYAFTISYIKDATGSTGIRDFTTAANITLSASPSPVISGLTTTPVNSTVGYSTPNVAGVSYSWSVTGTGASILSGAGTRTVQIKWGTGATGSVTLTETVIAGGCSKTTAPYIVTLTDIPNPVVSGNDVVCNGAIEIYSTPLVGTHTYSWAVTGGTYTYGATNNIINVTWTNTGAGSARVTEIGSATVSNTLPVTINPLPPINNTVSDPIICNGSSANIVITGAPAGITYQLRNNVGNAYVGSAISSGPGGDVTLTASPAGSTVYNIWATNEYSCGIQLTDLANVTVNPLPAIGLTVSGTNSICTGTGTNISVAASVIGTNYQLRNGVINVGAAISGTGGLINLPTGNLTSTTTFNVLASISLTGCSAQLTGTATVSVSPVIANNTVSSAQAICTATAPAALTGSTPTGGNGTYVYLWESSTTSAVVGFATASGTSNTISYTPAALAATTWYRRTVTSGGCNNISTAIQITVSPVIANNTVSSAQAICTATAPAALTGSTPTGGNTTYVYLWESSTTSAVAGFATASGTSNTIGYTPGALAATTWYRRTVTSGGCNNISTAIQITVSPVIANNTVSSAQAICTATAPAALTGSTPTGGNTTYVYLWESSTTSAVAGFATASGTSNTIGYTPGSLTQNTWYRRTVTSGGCSNVSAVIQITVSPTVTINAFSPVTSSRCKSAGSVIYTTTANNSTGITYALDPTTGAYAGNSINATTGEVTYAATWSGITTITASAAGCSGPKTASHTVTINDFQLWTGANSTDWNTAGNWSCGFVPVITTNVQIPNVANKPILSGSVIGLAKDITIAAGSSLTVTGNTLQIAGAITNTGTFTATAGTIEMKGSAAQTIGAGVFAGSTIGNLTISNPIGVTLTGPLNVTGIVTANGNLSSGGNLTLVSSATQTALISGTGTGNITGNVTMQRYLPSGFGYKYVSSPFQTATVSEFSPEVNLAAAFQTFYSYDENNSEGGLGIKFISGWVKYVTPANPLIPMTGYAANFGTNPAPKLVDATGVVNNGNKSILLSNHNRLFTAGFNLVGNPYPSPINWEASELSRTNVDKAIWLFNASATDQYGGVYSSYIGNIYSDPSANQTSTPWIIPSMQGFFVHVTDPGSGTLAMTNNVRTLNLSPTFKAAYIDSRTILRFSASFGEKNSLADGYVLYFDPLSSLKFESEKDALKMMNTDITVPNLYSISPDVQLLSINAIPSPIDSVTKIPLGFKILKDGWVNFNASDISKLPSDIHIYLTDAIGNVTQDLKQNSNYRFYLKTGEYNQRFTLVFSLSELNKPVEIVEKMFIIIRSGDRLYVKVNLPFNTKGDLIVTNMQGKTLLQKGVFEMETVEIDPNVGSGVYIVTIISGKRRESEKILIRKDYE